ncbi:hypothetical protein [Nocardia vaccinii]|uniref:hypothetical protein n=1 Tax=Nocardia vaccinii TaxID=1822 RepID=UPI000829CF69|nr:hypothetical protein [Nocardia vaccinii]
MASLVSLIVVVLGSLAATVILAYGAVAWSYRRRIMTVFRGEKPVDKPVRITPLPKADLAV